MTRLLEGRQPGRGLILLISQAKVHEDPVLAIDRRLPQALTGHGDQPGALLAGALRQELLQPHSQRGQGLGRHEGHLVPPLPGQFPQGRPQNQTKAVPGRNAGGTGMQHH
jgi:hypothetical protein